MKQRSWKHNQKGGAHREHLPCRIPRSYAHRYRAKVWDELVLYSRDYFYPYLIYQCKRFSAPFMNMDKDEVIGCIAVFLLKIIQGFSMVEAEITYNAAGCIIFGV